MQKYSDILSRDIISSEKRRVFMEHSLRKTVTFKEQMMSKDKSPDMFLHQLEAIIIVSVYYPSV